MHGVLPTHPSPPPNHAGTAIPEPEPEPADVAKVPTHTALPRFVGRAQYILVGDIDAVGSSDVPTQRTPHPTEGGRGVVI